MPVTAMSLVIGGVICFVFAVLGTALAQRYAVHRGLIDQPGERRSHAVATPRGGGIAIVVVMLAALLAVTALVPSQRITLAAAATGLLMVAGVGWRDDHRPLSALVRLAVHGLAAAVFALAVYLSAGSTLLALVAFVLTIGFVNAWNFMDGINGLAASQAAIAAAGYALVAQDSTSRWLCVALMSACLGFLPFNFPMAKIFLGDVGSGALGYILAVLLVLIMLPHGQSFHERSWMTPLLLLALPVSAFLIDTALTLARRIVRRERWWTPHVQHAYQRWAAADGSHRRVTLAYLCWSCLGIAVMLGTWNHDGVVIIAVVSAWYLGGGIVWAWLQSLHRISNKAGSA